MMKVILVINLVSSLIMLMNDLDVEACALMISLLSICEVMGTYMYIALIDLDCGHDLSLIRFYVNLNKYMCIMAKSPP